MSLVVGGKSSRRHFPFIAVAPSNASAKDLACADYVCDGVNDQVEVQAAIDSLSDGGEIHLLAGQLNFNDPSSLGYCTQITGSYVRLSIDSGCVVRLDDGVLSGSLLCNLIRVGDGNTESADIRIDGDGYLDGNRDNNPSSGDILAGGLIFVTGPVSNVSITRIHITNASRDAVGIRGKSKTERAQSVRVQGCAIEDCSEGICFRRADHIRITHNRFINMIEQDGVEPYESTRDWEISHNYFEIVNSGNSSIDVFPMSGEDPCENGLIFGNYLHGGVGYDFMIANASTGLARNIRVIGNHLAGGSMLIGTGTGWLENVSISANILDGSVTGTNVGILCGAFTRELSLSGNIIHDYPYHGVSVLACGVSLLGNRIFNNGQDSGFIGNRCGVLVSPSATGTSVVGNQIYDDQAVHTQQWPILADGSTNLFVENNSFFGHVQSNFVAANSAIGYCIQNNAGIRTWNSGADSVADGGTISHGLSLTPTKVNVTASVAGEIVSVTSKSATTFTVAIKKADGSAGTSQTIYWEAALMSMPVH